MLCDRVLGNVYDERASRYAGKKHDPLTLTWRDCTRRAVRARTGSGRQIGVLLPLGATLRHGDVLFETADRLVVVTVTPCEAWVANFPDATSMASAALELGNLHVPVEVAGGLQLVVLPDGPTRGVLDRHAGVWRAEVRRFTPLRATIIGTAVNVARAANGVTADTAAASKSSNAGGRSRDIRLADHFTITNPPPQLTNNRE